MSLKVTREQYKQHNCFLLITGANVTDTAVEFLMKFAIFEFLCAAECLACETRNIPNLLILKSDKLGTIYVQLIL